MYILFYFILLYLLLRFVNDYETKQFNILKSKETPKSEEDRLKTPSTDSLNSQKDNPKHPSYQEKTISDLKTNNLEKIESDNDCLKQEDTEDVIEPEESRKYLIEKDNLEQANEKLNLPILYFSTKNNEINTEDKVNNLIPTEKNTHEVLNTLIKNSSIRKRSLINTEIKKNIKEV